jgi:predicted N-acetyltransferase YhbS
VEIVEFGCMTPERRAELEGDEDDPFDAAGATLRYRPKDRHVALRTDRGRLVASAGVVRAEVEVEGVRFPAVGLGGVIVNADYRGRGYAREVVEAAVERARSLGPAFVVLFCHADRSGLYRRLGFQDVAAEVLVEQPDRCARMTDCMMWRGLRRDAEWPPGPVTLHSLPF